LATAPGTRTAGRVTRTAVVAGAGAGAEVQSFGIRTLRGQRAVFTGRGWHAERNTARAAGRKRQSSPAKYATGTGKVERAAVVPGRMLGKGNENHRADARIQATETRFRTTAAAAAAAVRRRPGTASAVDRRGETETSRVPATPATAGRGPERNIRDPVGLANPKPDAVTGPKPGIGTRRRVVASAPTSQIELPTAVARHRHRRRMSSAAPETTVTGGASAIAE